LREDCIATPLSWKNFSPNSLMTEWEFIKWIVKKYAISLWQADILSIPVRWYTPYYTQAKERWILKSTYKSKPTKVIKWSFMSQVIENWWRNVTMSNVSYTRWEMAMIFSVME
jgi:hypothetical protein